MQSAAVHHSFDKVAADELNYGPRAQKTDRAGSRPGLPQDRGPRVEAVTIGHMAASGPLLSTPLLADTAAADSGRPHSVFLLQAALKLKKEEEEEEEEEEREKECQREAQLSSLFAAVPSPLKRAAGSHHGTPQVEKEEDEQEEEEDSQNFFLTFLWCADTAKWAWLRSTSSSTWWWPCSSSLWQWHVHGWYCWFYTSRVVFLSVVVGPKMLDIMVGMDQKDSILRAWCAHRRLRQWHVDGWFCRYFSSRCGSYCCRQAQDGARHGRCEPEGLFRGNTVAHMAVV